MKKWNLYKSDDPQGPIGEVKAENYEQAVSAALAELGYYVEEEDDAESE